MSVKDICVVCAAKLQILPYAGTAYQLKAFGSCRFCLCHHILVGQTVLDMGEERMLMPGDHDIDIIRIDHVQSHRRQTDLRLSQHNIIQKVRKGQSVKSCGDAKAQTGHQHIHRIRA